MKRTLPGILALYCLPTILFAQINFQTKSWKEVLAEAKRQRKLIFVDIYTDWCGPCKMLDRTVFSNETVGKQFNGYFINYKANAERSGMALAAEYAVRSYPTGLFIDGDGQVVHRFVGYRPAMFFMLEGEQAMLRTPDGITMALQQNKFKEGDRSPALVRNLLTLHRKYGQETHSVLENYPTYQTIH
ncbi:thioredoxin family protein [Fibrella arboris]|uniref:thioredoxin family protein n=1 Tax=Fibrella arboris TaxID=3242486 RepID=UPI00351F8EF3